MTLASYHTDKKRLLLGTGGVLLFVAIGIMLMLHEGPRSSAFKDTLIFVGVVAPSLAMLLVALSAVLVLGPAVEITEHSIKWNVSLMSKGTLEWPQIKSVSCVNFGGTWFVKLEPHDMTAFLTQQPFLRRTLYRAMIRHNWPITPTCVPGTGLRDGSAGAIAKHVRRRIRAASNNSFKGKPLRGSP